MNYHNDKWVMEQIERHYQFATTLYKPEQIVGVFCQGSTNYGLDTKDSDIDTKCIIVPSLEDIILGRKPVSTTHIFDNDEHLDAKDIRLYIETFRKQNLNFLEILFTPYYILNPVYAAEWKRLMDSGEAIAHMNPIRAVKTMCGIAKEKYHAMEHRYPIKVPIIDKYGYDGKQVSHLIRVNDYLKRYIAGESYGACLYPSAEIRQRIMDYKALDKISLAEARIEAAAYLKETEEIVDNYCNGKEEQEDEKIRALLQEVSANIVRIALKNELMQI